MNDNQKTIRIFAISLGIFLVIAIFYLIFFMITSVFNLFDDNLLETNKYFELNNNYKITNLDIELGYTNLISISPSFVSLSFNILSVLTISYSIFSS